MHKDYLRLVYNHSCPQSFDGLSNVSRISLGQYNSSVLTFPGPLHLIKIMKGLEKQREKKHHLCQGAQSPMGQKGK